jgi:protein ImuB
LVLTLAHERYLRQRGMPATEVPFSLGAPARTTSHLLGVLRERLARVELPAPVEAIALASEETALLAGRNLGLLPGDEADRVEVRWSTACARVSARTRCIAWCRTRSIAPSSRCAVCRQSAKSAKLPALPDAPRPVWLLHEPQPLGHFMQSHPWVLRDGPERIESGWWDGGDVRRDYFVADTPYGATAWIYRDHRYAIDDGEWFLHGLFA